MTYSSINTSTLSLSLHKGPVTDCSILKLKSVLLHGRCFSKAVRTRCTLLLQACSGGSSDPSLLFDSTHTSTRIYSVLIAKSSSMAALYSAIEAIAIQKLSWRNSVNYHTHTDLIKCCVCP